MQALSEKYRSIKLATYRYPDFDMSNIQACMQHLYLDDFSHYTGKGRRIAGRGIVMLAEPAHEPNILIICHNCGKAGHYQSSCAVPGKACGRRNNPAGQMKAESRGGASKMRCTTVHKTAMRIDQRVLYARSAAPTDGSPRHGDRDQYPNPPHGRRRETNIPGITSTTTSDQVFEFLLVKLRRRVAT